MPTSMGTQPGPLITQACNSGAGRQPLGPLHPAQLCKRLLPMQLRTLRWPPPLHWQQVLATLVAKRCSANCIIGMDGKGVVSDGF